MIRILSSVNYSVQLLKKVRIKIISLGFSFWMMERPKQVKSTEAAAYYSLRLGFLKRNLWPRIHISSFHLYTNLPPENVISFKTRLMVRVNNCTVSPLSGKALYLQFLIHIDLKFFLKWGPEWVILIYSSMGFAYSSLFYMFFIVLVETTKSLILFLLYNCSPDTFSIIPSSGTCLISVGR